MRSAASPLCWTFTRLTVQYIVWGFFYFFLDKESLCCLAAIWSRCSVLSGWVERQLQRLWFHSFSVELSENQMTAVQRLQCKKVWHPRCCQFSWFGKCQFHICSVQGCTNIGQWYLMKLILFKPEVSKYGRFPLSWHHFSACFRVTLKNKICKRFTANKRTACYLSGHHIDFVANDYESKWSFLLAEFCRRWQTNVVETLCFPHLKILKGLLWSNCDELSLLM